MKKIFLGKVLAFFIVILFIGISDVYGFNVNLVNESKPLSRGWLYVGGTGPGNYSKIQDAIDNATSGDTVFVYNGTYYENVAINKNNINLVGDDKFGTIIQGNGTGYDVFITADWINLNGFTFKGASFEGAWLVYTIPTIVIFLITLYHIIIRLVSL